MNEDGVVRCPRAFAFLKPPARYKVAYGGRGSGKSWAFARELLVKGAARRLRILCTRELQRSIADSVHKLLADQIVALGLESFYDVQKISITGRNGTEFIFSGLQNSAALKSYEGVNYVWVEEAQVVSRHSWELLIPTIRAKDSEIWVSMNPELPTDDSYQRWVVNPPPGAVVRKINFNSNPYFPDVLRCEMEYCRDKNPSLYDHVWLGNPVSIVEGAIFVNELRAAEQEHRITRVTYDRARPADLFFDLGYYDSTAIWYCQSLPLQHNLIDYTESSGKTIEWYVREIQSKGFMLGWCYLPWDASNHAQHMGSGRSIEELLRLAGMKVRIVPKLVSKAAGINAARTIFPLCWFDQDRCSDGLQRLRHYRYGESEDGMPTRQPLHDLNSHGADAFISMAMMARPPKPASPEPRQQRPQVFSVWS
ncbi:MAG: PBSX family phage terminase large subunit [Acidobacteria bacterium]|nr:MAG: PBSX family phage terminase large subunit [Acidobacteriota bacterium]